MEYPALISEATFCQHYSSLWRELTPAADLLVRRLNRGGYERYARPMSTKTDPTRRAFINEIAFTLFSNSVIGKNWFAGSLQANEVEQAATTARQLIIQIEGRDDGCKDDPSDEERRDLEEQYRRLQAFFLRDRSVDQITVNPAFRGCGIIDTCSGDVLAGDTLWEVKAGDRDFRSIDLRQLITYAALNYISRSYHIERVGLFNPRVGIFFEVRLDDLCVEIGGMGSADMLAAVSYAISSGEISR